MSARRYLAPSDCTYSTLSISHLHYFSILGRYPPSPQRQGLYPHNGRLDISPERNHTNDNTQYIYDIVPISGDIAHATAVNAAMLVALESARERLSDKRALEEIGFGRDRGRSAGSGGEHVDGFEDEEAGECAAEVGYTVVLLVGTYERGWRATYVASSVM